MLRTKIFKKYPLNSNIVFFILTLCFLVGMIYGVVLIGQDPNNSMSQSMDILTKQYIKNKETISLLQQFWNSVFSSFIYITVAYIMGYCAVSQPVFIILPFINGLGISAFMTHLYLQYGFKGMIYSFFFIVPSSLICLFCILVSCREGIRLSNILLYNFFSDKINLTSVNMLKLYNLKYGIVVFISLLGGILDIIARMFLGNVIRL